MKIYLFEDDEMDANSIELVLKEFGLDVNDLVIISPIEHENLIENIFDLITSNEIGLIIFDYFFESNVEGINGAEFYNKIREQVDAIPLVILTNLKSEVEIDYEIDRDKIYSKKKFLAFDSDYQKEKAENILFLYNKYKNEKLDIIEKQKNVIYNMSKNELDKDEYKQYLVLSKNLSKMNPKRGNYIEDYISFEKLEEISSLIRKAEQLLDKAVDDCE